MWDLKKYDRHTAIIDDKGVQVAYHDLAAVQQEIAEKVGRRTLVVSLCKNSVGSIAGYVAFLNQRIVPILLNANLERTLLENLLLTYLPTYIWIPSDMVQEQLFSDMEEVYSEYDYSLLKTAYGKEYPLHDKLGLLLTTSGSTGSPKFVRQSYTNILSNAQAIVSYLKLDKTERPITTLPMNYTYGLSIINSHLLVGATILLTDKGLMQRGFWSFFRDAGATSFGGVPYTYEMLDRLHFMRMDLPTLRYMTQAGGKLSPELHKKFAKYAIENHKKFVVMYGQCEATARMAYLPAEDSLRKYGSMGIPIPGGSFSLIDANGQEILDAEVTGELVYTGANVTMGYAQKPEDMALGDEWNGCLETGDMAKRDEEGYYYIVGRKKRFLKVYGNRVNLDELDELIKKQYGNIECSCSGIDDHVYIFISDETEDFLKEQSAGKDIEGILKKYLSEKTRLNAKAFKVIVIKEIPKNDAGKIQYSELEKYYKSIV